MHLARAESDDDAFHDADKLSKLDKELANLSKKKLAKLEKKRRKQEEKERKKRRRREREAGRGAGGDVEESTEIEEDTPSAVARRDSLKVGVNTFIF